jgi:thioredoxin 1
VNEQVILTLNEENFDDHLTSCREPILVDFWASWCAPCKLIAPVLDELAEELSGRARIAKVDVEASGDLTNRFGVSSIPTLILFKDGRVVDQLIGAAPKDQIRRMVLKHLA